MVLRLIPTWVSLSVGEIGTSGKILFSYLPSVAIREGTLKNLEVTEEHFKALYDNVPFNYYVYDSSKISQLRQFATSNQIQVLIIDICVVIVQF